MKSIKNDVQKKNPGLTAEALGAMNMNLGNWLIYGDLKEFAPVANVGAIRLWHLKEDRWPRIDAALGRTLDQHQRGALNIACSFFVFACVYKDELPPARRYLAVLAARATEIVEKINGVIEMVSYSEEELRRVDTVGQVFMTPNEHFKAMGTLNWGEHIASVRQLLGEMQEIRGEILQRKPVARGADGHYELYPLLENLILVAKSAGDDLRITSQEFRAESGKEVHKPTPLVLFVEEMLFALQSDLDDWLARYDVSAVQKETAKGRISKILTKKTGNLLAPLIKMRKAVEPVPRSKNWRDSKTK